MAKQKQIEAQPAAQQAETPTTDLAKIKTVARQLAGEGWAVAILGHSHTAEARLAVSKVPMPMSAAERQEIYLAIIPAERGALRAGQVVAPLALGVRGDGQRVTELLQAQGLNAHYTGGDGDGAIVILPATSSQPEQPARDPELAELGEALHLVNCTTGGTISARHPLQLGFARNLADGRTAWWEGQIDLETLFELTWPHLVKRVDGQAAQPEAAAASENDAPHAEESHETPADQPITPEPEAGAPEKRKAGRPRKQAAAAA